VGRHGAEREADTGQSGEATSVKRQASGVHGRQDQAGTRYACNTAMGRAGGRRRGSCAAQHWSRISKRADLKGPPNDPQYKSTSLTYVPLRHSTFAPRRLAASLPCVALQLLFVLSRRARHRPVPRLARLFTNGQMPNRHHI